MTDNEIIKALECCGINTCCSGCPYHDVSFCQDNVDRDVLSLINRQKAEISELQHRISELETELDDLKRDDLPRCKDALRRANEIGMGLEKENQELKAEIESLKAILNIATKAKAKAIKEFAERVKEYIGDDLYFEIETNAFLILIDKIIYEMVGDAE